MSVVLVHAGGRAKPVTAIDVHKGPGRRYHSMLHRVDGVTVRLEGGSYNRIGGPVGHVPHDIAHLVVEDAFGLDAGLWGTLAAGGIVQNATFAGGRKPPHADRRARTITDRVGESLRQAEILVRAVADASLEGATRDFHAFRARVGDRWWSPTIGIDTLDRACAGLRDAAEQWDALAEGSVLRLSLRPPSAARGRRARAHGVGERP
jgi:hypothetical protein